MNWQTHCAAVIPCFNEAAQIGRVVAQIKIFLPAVIVVDDGSTDSTAEIAANAGAHVLQLAKNSGKGRALRAGWEYAQQLGFDWALMLDGDGQHSTADIPTFFEAAEKTHAKLIVGNRMDDCPAMPWLRRRANVWMSGRLSKLTGTHLPDSQCGFRLAHLPPLLDLSLRATRFEIESEMLVAFLAARQKIEFVPVQTIYHNRASHIQPLADTVRWFRWRLAQNVVTN